VERRGGLGRFAHHLLLVERRELPAPDEDPPVYEHGGD
jgi:hypothetical protein